MKEPWEVFFPNEMHAKWVLLAAMTVSYIYMKHHARSGLQVETPMGG